MSNELPGLWGFALGPKGVHSYRDVAARCGISAGTAHRLMTGGATSGDTVNKVADALFDGDRDAVWRLRGSGRKDYGDWSLPAEASLLTQAQRDAIMQLVQVMIPAEDASEPGPVLLPAKRATHKEAPLRAVASDSTGTSVEHQDEADARAAEAAEKQREAIADMKKKRPQKPKD